MEIQERSLQGGFLRHPNCSSKQTMLVSNLNVSSCDKDAQDDSQYGRQPSLELGASHRHRIPRRDGVFHECHGKILKKHWTVESATAREYCNEDDHHALGVARASHVSR